MLAQECRKAVMTLAAAYRRATGATLEQASRKFYGNRSFLAAYKAGDQSLSIDKFDEMITRLAAEWPEGADWPLRPIVIRPPKPTIGKIIPR